LDRLVLDADRAGFPLAVHAIGEKANAVVLDAFEKAAAANAGAAGPQAVAADGKRDRRPRIEHAQVVRDADVARYATLGVVASIQPTHAIDDMRWAEKRIGKERLHGAYRIRSFLDRGIPVAFGTDFAVEPLDPRLGLHAAVARQTPEGEPKGGFRKEEGVTLAEAIDLYTRGSAYAEFAETRKGTLEVGKLGDFVVFAEDLFALEKSNVHRIASAPIDMTVVGGRVVFERTGR
ncbi:MAG TPA: amidohydrolase family protein, partial [Thermoanaerobaculia bacterium]|nr:amidohydrolase family protein [Thermoanaerobaculia bacterium]